MVMNALILSCGTGGGHNAAAEAIRGELLRRGWNAELLNPYILCGKNAAKWLNQTYIRLVQRFPAGFGMIYRLGEMCQRLPFRSPVYLANGRAAVRLGEYLHGKRFDVIIATHLFPGEMVTRLKHGGAELPPVVYIATDYTCVPFTEDLDCDAYVIPTEELVSEFVERGIPRERIYPLGIPVRAQFRKPLTKAEAKQTLWLDQRKTYFLISGGSMGAGKLLPMIQALWTLRKDSQHLIVVCGSNKRLYRKLQARYGDGMVLLRKTERMAECIRASDIYFTKPGGLSSTEAAVVGVALVHLPPIPGCESKNAEYFEAHGMSIRAEGLKEAASRAMSLLDDAAARDQMLRQQRSNIRANATEAICDLAHQLAEERKRHKEDRHEGEYQADADR